MSKAGVEKVAVTVTEKPLALTGTQTRWSESKTPPQRLQLLKMQIQEIVWTGREVESSLLKNNHLEKFFLLQLPRHAEATKALTYVGRTTS